MKPVQPRLDSANRLACQKVRYSELCAYATPKFGEVKHFVRDRGNIFGDQQIGARSWQVGSVRSYMSCASSAGLP